jgi:predicted GNAT superfamily acetyltransferase
MGPSRARVRRQNPRAGARPSSRVYCSDFPQLQMAETKLKPAITIRDLQTFEDIKQVEEVEREVWGLSDLDTTPLTLSIATREAGSIWVGAFDGAKLVGFAFAFLGTEHGQLIVHSHMLAVREPYRNSRLGYKLKLAQRERALALRIDELRIKEMTWTFDPLQSRNAHLNFSKLGVVSESYKIDFYGPETSSVLHRNSTDRLWVTWPIASRRVQDRILGKENRAEVLDALSILAPLVQFNGDGKPVCTDLTAALSRQRIAIEIPSDIGNVEQKDPTLAKEWRRQTRWAFTEALKKGFVVAEFCRTVRGQQGPGVYLLEKGRIEDIVPEMTRPNSR